MVRAWSIEPTSDRIISDILDWEDVIDKIIAAGGCVVHGLALRHGHRERAIPRLDRKGLMQSRMQKHQRKVSAKHLRRVHPDAETCYERLIAREGELGVAAIAAGIEDHLNLQAMAVETLRDVVEDVDEPEVGKEEMIGSFLCY